MDYKTSEAQRRANKTYRKKNAAIAIHIPPDMKAAWDSYTKSHDISLRQLIISSVNTTIQNDASKSPDLDA